MAIGYIYFIFTAVIVAFFIRKKLGWGFVLVFAFVLLLYSWNNRTLRVLMAELRCEDRIGADNYEPDSIEDVVLNLSPYDKELSILNTAVYASNNQSLLYSSFTAHSKIVWGGYLEETHNKEGLTLVLNNKYGLLNAETQRIQLHIWYKNNFGT